MIESWALVGTLRRGVIPITLLGLFLTGCASDMSSDGFSENAGGSGGAPTEPAPTGQRWEAVEDDKGCGRTGIKYVLVDEVCGRDGLGYDDPQLQAPMFRDGALFGSTLLAVDATHLWALDLSNRADVKRTQLLSGLGQPVAAAAFGTELLLAAGDSGLLRLDASDPLHPSRTGRIELPGFALDVETEGQTAHVAMGRAGLGIVNLATGVLEHTVAIPGYATGVTTKNGYAYVASCDALSVVDLASHSVVARTWTPYAMDGSVLGAAAKDVTVVDDVAFVAAGRHGAVSIDVADPQAPQIIGNCTLPEPSFYASGVRAKDGQLFVAGGEYGILPVDVSNPRAACPNLVQPVQAPPTEPAPGEQSDAGTGTCSTEPPWEVLPWENLWAPPPPRKDPIQTLPGEGVVYAFGDARRIGTRAVDVRETASFDLPLIGRYDEPRRALGIAASGARVLVVGSLGGLFTYESDHGLLRTPSDRRATFEAGTAAVFTGGGRWAVLEGNELHVEGLTAPLTIADANPEALAAVGMNGLAVASKNGIEVFDVAEGSHQTYPLSHSSTLPLSIAANAVNVYAAAPEWPRTSQLQLASGTSSQLSAHGVFDAEEALDTTLWRTRLPRRQLVTTHKGLVEVAVIGRKAGLVMHGDDGNDRSITIPAATFSAATADAKNVYITSIDRAYYRSALFTVAIDGNVPTLIDTQVFTGGAAGVASGLGHTYVADADGNIRVYRSNGAAPSLEAVVSLEEAP